MSAEQNKALFLDTNHFGSILIHIKDIQIYIDKYLKYFLDKEFKIDSINVVELENFYPVVKITLLLTNSSSLILDKIDFITSMLEKFLKTNLGLKITSIQVGIKFLTK